MRRAGTTRGDTRPVVDAAGNATVIEHDARDLPVRRVTADGLVTTFAHDDKGTLTRACAIHRALGLRFPTTNGAAWDLDVLRGEAEKSVRGRTKMIRGLIDRADTPWLRRRYLSAKIFLREDIFRTLNLEEEAKYATRNVERRTG